MRVPNLDPTAGETARTVRLDPDAEHPVTDPTNPRYGAPTFHTRELGGRVGHVVDPTDPACAERSD